MVQVNFLPQCLKQTWFICLDLLRLEGEMLAEGACVLKDLTNGLASIRKLLPAFFRAPVPIE